VKPKPKNHGFLGLIAKFMNELLPETNQFTSTLDNSSMQNFNSFYPAVWSENRHGRIF